MKAWSAAVSRLVAALLLLAGPATRAVGADPSAVPPAGPGPAPISLTISGGVSLGAYEAGFLYYALAIDRANGGGAIRLVTGTSAGSLNGLLAVLAACGGDAATPGDSLFWRTWIPVGLDRLLDPSSRAPLGVFSRGWLEEGAKPIEATWNHGLPADCDVVLGATATRLTPRTVAVAGGRLELPRTDEKYAVRIRGRGPGVPPLATNYVDPADPVRHPLLLTDADGAIAFPELRDLILASMSFPVAFPPQPLRTCAARRDATRGICPEGEAEAVPHVDGGLLDNGPLRLAARLAGAGLERAPDGGWRWRDVPRLDGREPPPELVLTFIDPDVTDYPVPPALAAGERSEGLPAMLGGIAGAFFETARSKELTTLVEEHPQVADRVVLPQRHFPAAGSPLAAFTGFFETDFRVFDFYLGMYEARRTYDEEVRRRLGAAPPDVRYPEPPAPAASDAGVGGWTPFACLRAVLDGVGSTDACAGEALRPFRAVLQASLDQLYGACALAGASHATRRQPIAAAAASHCDDVDARGGPPSVPGVETRSGHDFHRRPDEGDLAYAVRLLEAHGFAFRDLGVPAGDGGLALTRIRGALARVGARLAETQPPDQRRTVAFAAKLAADSVSYAPPASVLHFTTGPTETEIGWGHGFPDAASWRRHVRIGGVLVLRGLDDLLSSGGDTWSAATLLALEAQPPARGAFSARLRLGLRAGWLWSADDRFGTGRCSASSSDRVGGCSRPLVQAVVGVSALERFRLQLVGEWLPGTPHRQALWSFAPGIGLEFTF